MQNSLLHLPLLQLAALLTVASCFSASTTKTLPVSIEPRRNVASPDDEKLRQMQQIYRPIVESFVPSEFNPHPALTNKHLQTISGVFLRKNLDCAYVTKGVGGVTKVLQEISSIVVPTSNKVMLGDDKAIGDDPSNTF